MRLLFFGTPDFAVPSLLSLHQAGHEVELVVTRPDRPRGRGRKPAPSAVKRAALDLDLDICQPDSVNNPDVTAELADRDAEIGVVVAYGEILGPPLLRSVPRGFLNLHASLLPKYRGAAPINWAIMRGEEKTGVTVQRMVPEMDAGPMLEQRAIGIGRDETAGKLHDRLAEVGASAITDVVNRLDRGEEIPEQTQDSDEVTYAPKLEKKHGRVDWSLPAEEIRNRVRGVTPWPGAVTRYCGQNRCEEVTLMQVQTRPDHRDSGEPGTVVEITDEERVVVRAGRGLVVIDRIKPANSREMDAADFVHGHRVQTGDIFE